MSKQFVLKYLLIFLGIGLAITFVLSQLGRYANDASLDNWDSNFQGYVKSSRMQLASGQPMLLFFYTDWCPNCKKLREEILSHTEVKLFIEGQIHPVKINPEAGAYENQLAEDYKVMGYPTILLVDEKTGNTQWIKQTSNISPAQFIQQLQNALVKT